MEDVFKAIQGLAAALVSVVIAASVAYETGYFSIIGKKYQGILSATDYLSSALEWLPWLCLLCGTGFLFARVCLSRLSQLRLRAFKVWPRASMAIALCLALGACFVAALVPFFEILLYLPIVVLFAVATLSFSLFPKIEDVTLMLTVVALSTIAVLLALYCSGIGHAHRDIIVIDNAYILKSGSDIEGAQILRVLQKGLLLWKPRDNKVDLVSWDKVDRTTHLIWKSQDAPWFEPLGCNVWTKLCRNEPPPTP